MRRGPALLLLAALCVAGPTSVAHAQSPSAADRETARGLLDRGQDKEERGDIDGAIEDFRAAHAIMGVPSTAAFLAEAQLARRLLVDALDTASSVERIPVAPDEPPQYADARARCRRVADDARRRVPTLRLTVLGPAPGAEVRVTVDGAPVRSEALTALRLNPGPHRIEVAASGFRAHATTVELVESTELPATISLVADPDAPPLPPEGEVAGDVTGPAASSAGPPWPVIGLVALGVGGASIAVGAITGAVSASQTTELEPQCQGGCPPELADDLDSAKTMATVSTITWIAGSVLVATGVTILLVDASRSGSPPVALRVAPGRLSIDSRF